MPEINEVLDSLDELRKNGIVVPTAYSRENMEDESVLNDAYNLATSFNGFLNQGNNIEKSTQENPTNPVEKPTTPVAVDTKDNTVNNKETKELKDPDFESKDFFASLKFGDERIINNLEDHRDEAIQKMCDYSGHSKKVVSQVLDIHLHDMKIKTEQAAKIEEACQIRWW